MTHNDTYYVNCSPLLVLSYFRHEDSRESVIVREVGNVTADTELTYEYGVRTRRTSQEGGQDGSKQQKATPEGLCTYM